MRTRHLTDKEFEEALGAALRGEAKPQPTTPKPARPERPPRTKLTCHYTATDRWGDNPQSFEFSEYTIFQSAVEIKAQREFSKLRLANIRLVKVVRTEE